MHTPSPVDRTYTKRRRAFSEESVRELYERCTYERTFISEIIAENHAISKLPRGLYERTFMSEAIENHAISDLSSVLI